MRKYNEDVCNKCGAFVSMNAKEGDMTCTTCGEVASSHFMLTAPSFTTPSGYAPKKTSESASSFRHIRTMNVNSQSENRENKIRGCIVSLVSDLSLGSELLVPRAMRIYNELVRRQCPRVKKDELLATACVFVALRQSNTPFSFNELVNRCNNVSKRELGRCCKRCYVFLQKEETSHTTASVLDTVPRYASILGFNRLEIMLLKTLTKTVEKSGIIRGNNPLSIVSAVFLFIGQKIGMTRITIKHVAKVLNVAENTVVKAIQYLKNEEEKIFTDEVQKRVKKCIKKRIL